MPAKEWMQEQKREFLQKKNLGEMCITVIMFTCDGTAKSGEEHQESQSRGIAAGNTEQHWAVTLNRRTGQHQLFQGIFIFSRSNK